MTVTSGKSATAASRPPAQGEHDLPRIGRLLCS